MFTHTQLEYLVAVDRYGSFSTAATRCFVTQPTLSMQIRKLETELGVTLFDRGRKPVKATSIGRKVIAGAYRALHEWKGIAELVREAQEGEAGELRLGIIPTLGPYLLPRFVPDLLAAHPGLRITVREMLSSDIVEELRRDTLDAGLAATPLAEKGIRESPLFYEPFSAFIAAGHPLAAKKRLRVADLTADEMLLMDSGHCLHGQVSRVCGGAAAAGDDGAPRLRFVGGSLEGVLRIVGSGHGMTLLPELAVMGLPAASRRLLHSLDAPVPTREVSLITHGDGVKTRLLEILRQAVVSAVPERLKQQDADWRIIDAKGG